jgi:hypothetical protein
VLRWPPAAFWQSNVWEAAEAWEGYALSKGIKKQGRISDDDAKEMRRELEAAKKLHRAKYGNA